MTAPAYISLQILRRFCHHSRAMLSNVLHELASLTCAPRLDLLWLPRFGGCLRGVDALP